MDQELLNELREYILPSMPRAFSLQAHHIRAAICFSSAPAQPLDRAQRAGL
ncbi:MAG: hypothetical protein J5I81_13325 [Nitrococcus mobilis]|nr:hypothetical protein [Nitrococcus mobilis]